MPKECCIFINQHRFLVSSIPRDGLCNHAQFVRAHLLPIRFGRKVTVISFQKLLQVLEGEFGYPSIDPRSTNLFNLLQDGPLVRDSFTLGNPPHGFFIWVSGSHSFGSPGLRRAQVQSLRLIFRLQRLGLAAASGASGSLPVRRARVETETNLNFKGSFLGGLTCEGDRKKLRVTRILGRPCVKKREKVKHVRLF